MPDSHCPTKTLSVHGDMEKRRLFHVPASQFELLEKLLHCVVSQRISMNFRCTSVVTSRRTSVELSIFSGEFPSNFRIFQVIFRWTFDELSINFRWTSVGSPPNLRRTFDSFSLHFYWFSTTSNSTLTNHDNLAYIFTPMMNFLRTIFTVYVNRGLLDAIPLPRTTPDKHENYHQCVCFFSVLIFEASFQQFLVEQKTWSRWFSDPELFVESCRFRDVQSHSALDGHWCSPGFWCCSLFCSLALSR